MSFTVSQGWQYSQTTLVEHPYSESRSLGSSKVSFVFWKSSYDTENGHHPIRMTLFHWVLKNLNTSVVQILGSFLEVRFLERFDCHSTNPKIRFLRLNYFVPGFRHYLFCYYWSDGVWFFFGQKYGAFSVKRIIIMCWLSHQIWKLKKFSTI